MKWVGIILLVVGFIWMAADIQSFTEYQYTQWMWQTKNLTAGDVIKRTEAINAMRDLTISLNDRHKRILIPTLCMLAGALISEFSKRRKNPPAGN